MWTIDSFSVDHTKLKRGLYVAGRVKVAYETLTTFDVRLKRPYVDEVMDTGAVHAIEHLGAVFLRNDELWGHKIVYWGPMGCRTGFYLIMFGELEPADVLPLIERLFDYIAEYDGEIPGANPKECGYCVDMSLSSAKIDAAEYYNLLIDAKKENFNYPKKREKKAKE